MTEEKDWSEKRSISFEFEDFENLEHGRGNRTLSQQTPCHGHLWSLSLYPGGAAIDNRSENPDSDEIWVAVYLNCCDDTGSKGVEALYGISSVGENNNVSLESTGAVFRKNEPGWGFPKFATRTQLVDNLVNGTLKLEVDIQINPDSSPRWKPTKSLSHDMADMYQSREHTDVTFEVGKEKFPCHRCVLARRAPGLVAIAEDVPHGSIVPIDGFDPVLFNAFLHFAYSEQLPSTIDSKKESRTLLEIADKFACKSLKLHAEAEIVDSGITVDNVCELLLFADGMNCALLKEAATKFFVSKRHHVIKTSGYSKVEESLKIMKELLRATSALGGEQEEQGVDSMDVAHLRRNLEKRGLDVDGTREMLVKRLKRASSDDGDEIETSGMS